MRFKDTYCRITEAVLKHPTKDETQDRLTRYYVNNNMMDAARKGYYDAVKGYVDRGADVNARDDDGYTSLIWASDRGHTDIVRLLLDAGADVDARNKYMETAFMLASGNGHTDIVDLLKKYGAR